MAIIQRPPGLKLSALLSLLSIPLFVLNIWILDKSMSQKYYFWIALQSSIVVVSAILILRANKISFWLLSTTSVLLIGANIYFLVRYKNYALAFYALFLFILFSMYLSSLFRILKDVFYDSGKRWFEGSPQFLPRVQASLYNGNDYANAKLSKLAIEGCYVYSPKKFIDTEKILLKLDAFTLNCEVELISKSSDGLGQGLKFIVHNSDELKDIYDFIDKVRSAGYDL